MAERPDPLAPPEGYGASRARQHPAAQQRLAEPVHDGRCDVRGNGLRCPEKPNWTIWYGCPAEHVAVSDVCDDDIRGALTAMITCGACDDKNLVRPEIIRRLDPPGEWRREVPAAELPALAGPDLSWFFSGPAGGGRFA